MKKHFINNPVFLKIKPRFNWRTFKTEKYVKQVFINERVVETPFVISRLGRLPKGSAVLDLGCTESVLPLYLAALGYEVTGTDFRVYPYEVPHFTFRQADIMKLPFPDESFDAVTCISTLEHIGIGHYADPRHEGWGDLKAIEEAARVLRRGGRFLLSVPFGCPREDSFQRVYDGARLDRLLAGFKVDEAVYYVNCPAAPGALNNAWAEVDRATAAKSISEERTNGVCIISASRGLS
ncbi:MAG: class I SAM-dependent methyltransferase [Candidatus Omnitrophota bacterium]